MNVKQVKEHWTIPRVLECLGVYPDQRKSKAHDLWFCSPFRNETEPSLHVNVTKDIWMDFGLAEEKSGGDLIYFAQKYLESRGQSCSVSDALRWFSELSGGNYHPKFPKTPVRAPERKQAQFKLLSVKPIFTEALIDYLGKRRIREEVGRQYLQQVYFEHTGTGRKVFGLGMKNEAGGYEVRSPLGFKAVVGSKAITTVFGEVATGHVAVFEGMFDFLSWVCMNQQNNKPLTDAIIMHTNRLYARTSEVITARGYHTTDLWLDNDKGGRDGVDALREAVSKEVRFVNNGLIYSAYKDLSAWWECS